MAVRDWVKTMASRTRSTLDGHPKLKEELHRCSHFWLTQSHKPLWLITSSKLFTAQHIEPCISPWLYNGCESRSLQGGWSLLILRWYLPGERIWRSTAHSCLPVGRGFHCIPYLAHILLGTYLLTTYTYKRMHLLNRVYGTLKVSDYSGWPLSYSYCCCCHSNKTWFIITFVLYSRCKWHIVECSFFLIARHSLSLQLTSVLPVTCYAAVLWPELRLQWQSADCLWGCSGIQPDTNTPQQTNFKFLLPWW